MQKIDLRSFFILLACVTVVVTTMNLSSCSSDNEEDLFAPDEMAMEEDTLPISYATQIIPILENNNCLNCHNESGANVLGAGNVLEGYDNLRVYVDNGALVGVLDGSNDYTPMPPGGSITSFELELIQQWIEEGAENN